MISLAGLFWSGDSYYLRIVLPKQHTDIGDRSDLAELVAVLLYLCTWRSVTLLPGMPSTFDLCSKV